MRIGVIVACRLLPALARQIEELASHDESFDELCEDLAVAELALTNLRQQPEPISKQQLSEYEGWMVSLTAEIEDAVGHAGHFNETGEYKGHGND